MKANLAVVAVLLAVIHVGDTHGDHTRPHPPFHPVTITDSTYNVREGSCINVIVRTILVHDFNSTVFLIIADGGEDFEDVNITVNFRAGENVSLVSLCAKDDDIVELPENFILYIQVGHEAFHHGVTHMQNGTVMIFLEDNDSGTVSFSSQNYIIPEGTDAELTFVLDKAFAIDLTFNVTTTDDTATSPIDYTGGNYSVTIPALKKEGKVSVLTTKSGDLEPDEHFIATLHVPEHPRLSTGLTTAIITINDRTIPVVFEHATYKVTEGPGVKAITITLKTLVQRDYPFAVVVSTQSGSADGDDDFQDENYLVRFPGQAKEADFTVTIFDDDIAECCEEFFLELLIPPSTDRMGVIKGDLSNAKVIINDADFAEMNFKDQTYTVGEGETVDLTIELDKDFSCGQRKVFCIQTIDDTATAGEDYVSVNKCLTFEPNTTYSVETIPDATPETNECFNVTIYVPEMPCALNVILGKKNTATVCLCDSARARIGFKNAFYNVSEGMQARLVVALYERAKRDIEFTVTTRDGTAESHGEIDYFSINTTSTIPAGTLEESVVVKTQKNRLMDPLEYFFADLSVSGECKNVDLVTKTAKITIVDISVLVSLRNDSNEAVTYDVKEDVNHTCVTLKAVGPSIETAFDVIVVATDGSATYPSDYAAREVTATFLPGETTANACIPIVDDDDHECLEWFTLELKLTQAAFDLCAALSSPATARVLIEDNDVVGIDFDPQTYNITEGDLGELSFSLNRTSQTNISFIAMTMNRTADGSDYVGGNFPATIHAGMKNITLPLVTKADVLLEGTEFLEVVIEPNGTQPNCSAVVAGPPANVSIIDGTVPVKFSASVYHVCTVKGNNTSVEITLEAMKDRKFDFTVNVRTKDGTATRNSDYDEKPVIQVTFRDEQNVTIHIAIVAGDVVAEPPETFTVELEIPEDTKGKGVVAVEPSTAEIVITDVQIGTFSPQNYTVREGDVEELTIKLDRPSVQDTIFNVATMNLTATTYDDYFRHNYNITVPAGALVATTRVITQRNTKIEPEEHFKAIVRPVVECALEDNRESTAYIKITDCTVLVKFSSAIYTATEGLDPKVVITVQANGAVDKSNFTVRVIAKDDSATRGDDYVIKDTLLLFKQSETEHSFSINITDDMLAEPHEIFTLELEQPQQTSTVCIAKGSPDITHVTIADDDVVTVSCSPQNYTVSEGIPATLGMVLDKEASERITVFVTTMDITAGSLDYVQESRTPVTFAPRSKRTTLPLLTLRDTVINEPNESLKAILDLEPTTVRVEIGPDPCFVTIVDATVGVNFRSDKYTVGEGDGKVTVTVDASKEHADFDFKIIVKAQDDTATIAIDLVKEEVPVTFPAGKTTVEASIEIVDDEIAECPEMFKLELDIPEIATGNGVVAIAPNTAEIMIMDNDEVNITFKAPTNYTVREGDSATIVLEVQGESSKDIIVTVTFTPITAESNVDYRVESNMVTIPAHANNVSVTLETLPDTEYDGTETLKADLSITLPPVNVTILPATAYITILDTTVPVQFKETTVTVQEGENVTVTLIALANHSYGFVVNVKVMDGTAKRGSDYNATEVIQVQFPANQNSVDFSIHIIDNDIAECQKQFELLLEVPENASDMGVVTKEDFTVVVHITDDWDAVNITFSQMTYTVQNEASVLVSLRSDSNEEVSYNAKEGVIHTCVALKAVGANIETAFDVTVIAKNGSATYPSDYAAREVTATFLPGETTANACIPIVDDEDHECLEWFTLELKLTQGAVDLSAVVSSPDTARVLIEDNDVVSIDFDSLKYNITEGDLGELSIFLNRRSQTTISFIVMLMDGTADGSDYVGGNFPATIPAGIKTVILPLVAKADDVIESTEFLSVVIKPNAAPPNCSAVVAGPPANVSIIDGTVPVKFSASVYHVCTVRGRPSSVAITLEAMKDHKFDFTVKVHIRDGTAKRNSDYDEEPVITERFSNQQKIVTIPIAIVAGGEVAEPPENFTVELEIPEDTKSYGVVAVEPSTAEIVITDVQIGTFSPQNYTVREGEVARFTIVLDRPSVEDTIFNVATMSLTATTFDDYFRHNYNVTVPAGAMQATTTVVTQRDANIEAEEHFKAIVRPSVECNFEDNGESTAYITITDCTVLVKFSSAMYTATEGMDPKVVITVLANGAVDESDFTVRVIAKDDSATSGDDYVIKETLLLFKRGESEHSFSINITDDMLAEPYELFTLELERPQQGSTVCVARGIPDITYVGLVDDDVVTVSCSPQNYTVSEGIPAALWMVLDKEASESITVFVTTMDITAGSADYVQENGTPVKFAPGATSAALPLLTFRDTVISEPNESLKVTLDLEPTTVRVEVAPDQCFVTISDATVGVNFRSAMYMVGEGDGSVTVTVDASKEHAAFDFVVKMVARDGTAETLSDLHEQEVKLTFQAGKTTVDASIGINDDEVAESIETFYLVLEIPVKATGNAVVAIAPNTTEIKIIDNDVAGVYFDPDVYPVNEGGNVTLILRTNITVNKRFSVLVNTRDDSANNPADYQGGERRAIFEIGSNMATVEYSTVNDGIRESMENFTAKLKVPPEMQAMGIVPGMPDSATVDIIDDEDYPQCSFRLCKRRKNALCTLPNATGNCTFKVTACRAAYYSMNERSPPPKCGRRNKCAGLIREPLEKCLKKWASCVKKAFKAQLGKTPDNLRKNAYFKALEYPCGV